MVPPQVLDLVCTYAVPSTLRCTSNYIYNFFNKIPYITY
jgi:hypothetical protein